MDGVDQDGSLVVVPHAPGPLLRPGDAGRRRSRDELDDLIDDLFPDSEGGPTWFDAVLLAGGTGLLIWALTTGGPAAAVVIAVIMLTIGCMLPLRSLLRAVVARRRAAVVQRGVPLRLADPATARLVESYEGLLALEAIDVAALSAAHAAMLESATLLGGRGVETDRERAYVEARAGAIRRLTAALAAPRPAPELGAAAARPGTDALLDAREELDLIGGVNSLSRLDELTAEVRGGDGGTR